MRLRLFLAALGIILVVGLSGCDPGQTTWKTGGLSLASARPMGVQP